MGTTNDFAVWLSQNGLTLAFTTGAGDTLYTNVEKLFGVLKKANECGVHSFYLDDVEGFQVYDDEHLVAHWNGMGAWHYYERSTRYSSNEIYIKLFIKNQQPLKLQLFKATHGNIERDSVEHMRLFDYACQMAAYLYDFFGNFRK